MVLRHILFTRGWALTPYWYISNDFTEKRSTRIGASEVSCLIPNPEKPNESLAGYERTAITLWQEKTGRKERDPSGLSAEMGHWNEVKAIELFIRGIPEIGPTLSENYTIKRLEYELLNRSRPGVFNPSQYQSTPWKHTTQWYNDQFICHPDGIYDPYIEWMTPDTILPEHAHGYNINLKAPFLIEAKTASFWSAKRREGSLTTGYDFDLRTGQGIPLKHYVQIQFQLACLDVEVCYLPLLYDSASFHVWEIRRDRKVGDQLIDLAGRMAWHIQHDTPPKELAMNGWDIQALYPEIKEDFVFLSGEKADAVKVAAQSYTRAAAQEKVWKQKKADAVDALAVYLKDNGELRVELDGVIVPIAKWKSTGGGERVMGIKDLRMKDEKAYKYLKRKGLIAEAEKGRSVNVCWKEE